MIPEPPPGMQQYAANWFDDLRTQVADLIAAGLDATAPAVDRVLSRAEARAKVEEAAGNVRTLLDAVDMASLPPPTRPVPMRNSQPGADAGATSGDS